MTRISNNNSQDINTLGAEPNEKRKKKRREQKEKKKTSEIIPDYARDCNQSSSSVTFTVIL